MVPLVSIFLFCVAGVLALFFFSGMLWGVGYSPTSYTEIDKVAKLLDLKESDILYDLGCGYGRVIFRVAQKYGVNSVGIEADPVKCWWIRHMILRKKLEGRVRIIKANLLDIQLKDIDNMFIFLTKVTPIMARLQDKALKEMKPGAKIVSYVHTFDNWTPQKSMGELYLYAVPSKAKI